MPDRDPLLHEGRLPHAYAVSLKPRYHYGLQAQRILIVNILCGVRCPKVIIIILNASSAWSCLLVDDISSITSIARVKHSPLPFFLLNWRRYSKNSKKHHRIISVKSVPLSIHLFCSRRQHGVVNWLQQMTEETPEIQQYLSTFGPFLLTLLL